MPDASFFYTLISYSFLGLNWMDIFILFVFGFYIYEGYELGFVLAFLDFFSFVLSFLLALRLYNVIAHLLNLIFTMPIGFANAIGFFVVALFVEIAANILFRSVIYPRIPTRYTYAINKRFRSLNQWFGIIPGIVSAGIVVAFLLTLIVAIPTSPYLKTLVDSSVIASRFVMYTTTLEGSLNNVFGGALQETMSYMTVEPESKAFIQLHYTVKNSTVDAQAEESMLIMVNYERTSRGEEALLSDPQLTQLARTYGKDMFARGYFSHYNPENESPFARMEQENVAYTSAGENLALAPTTDLAMQGLMNSPGHKANILSTSFKKVGIGVVDGGIYGKIFVQEFTN